MKHYTFLNQYLDTLQGQLNTYDIKQGKHVNKYFDLRLGFDIETTTFNNGYDINAYMYIWQLGVGHKLPVGSTEAEENFAFYGNTWEEFRDTLTLLDNFIKKQNEHLQAMTKRSKKTFKEAQALCFIHNISFEWQFLRKEIKVKDVFLKDTRQPLYFNYNNIKFLDSLQITHMSLAKLAKRYTKTQKMVGDIDYTLPRNTTDGKHLTEKEMKYCENDVIILCEYAQYYFDTYLAKNELIYTETSIVRHKLKEAFKAQSSISLKDIALMFPHSFNEYKVIMEYLFQGGWVKSAVDVFGKVLTNINCYDITSSYPAQIAHRYFPMSNFHKITVTTKAQLNHYLETYCCILDVTLENVKKTSIHSIISSSKVINKDTGRVVVDNGRIAECDKLRMMFTELDWEIFNKFYDYDKCKIKLNILQIAQRGKLPDYVISTMLDAYEKKEALKLQGKDYYNEKAFVNMFYGCFVTRIHQYNYEYKFNEDKQDWEILKTENDYVKAVRGSILSPYWGIYATSWARWQELSACWENRQYVVYGDTDSLKGYNMPSDYFEKYNAIQVEKNKKLAEKYNKDYNLIKELGCWDREKSYKYFKTLGCKRYIGYNEDNQLSVTIAGIPKGTLEKTARIKVGNKGECTETDALKVMTLLKDKQTFKNCKLTAKYNDDITTDIINNEEMTSKSSIALVNVDYTLTISDEYKQYIHQALERYDREIAI